MNFKGHLFFILLFFSTFCCTNASFSQQQNKSIDSLLNTLKTATTDSLIIGCHVRISEEFRIAENYNIAEQYISKALKMCDSVLLLKKEPKIVYLKALVIEENGNIQLATGKDAEALDSYKKSLETYHLLKMDSDISLGYENIALVLYQMGKYDEAIKNQQMAIFFVKKINDYKGTGICYNILGDIYSEKGDVENALKYYTSSLYYSQMAQDIIRIAETFQNLGIVYADIGNYKKAIECDNKSIKIYEKINNKIGMAQAYNSIGCRYGELKDHDKSIFYFEKSVTIANEIKDSYSISLALKNIGVSLKNKKKYDESLSYLKKSLKICDSIYEAQLKSMIFNSLGDTYREMGNNDSALFYFQKGLEITEKINDKKGTASVLNDLGIIYTKQKQFKKAEAHCLKSLQIAQQLGYPKNILNASEQLCIIYEHLEKYKDAYAMHKIVKKMTDSLYGKESSTALANYEYEKRLLQIAQEQIRRESALVLENQKKLTQKNYWIFGSLGFLILTVVSGGLIYKIKRQRQIEKTMILEQKLLRTQMNPHFIFNTLASIQNFIYKDKKAEAHTYVGKFAKLMRSILENSREEFVSMEQEIKTLENYLSLNQLLLDNKFTFEINIDKNIEITNTQIPPMLAQPFIENALKHGISNKEEPGVIKIAFNQIDEKNIQFEVEDNGIGLSKIITADTLKHKSFATIITRERLENLYNNKNVVISITEIRNTLNEITGTKTLFTFPFKYI